MLMIRSRSNLGINFLNGSFDVHDLIYCNKTNDFIILTINISEVLIYPDSKDSYRSSKQRKQYKEHKKFVSKK